MARWLRSRFVFGTFFFQGLSLEPSSSKVAPRKFRRLEFLRHIGATQRLARRISGSSLELVAANLGGENFENGTFGDAEAPRSVSLATQGAEDCGKFVALAVCLWNLLPPTWAAKILKTEILATHRRHAAFRSRCT